MTCDFQAMALTRWRRQLLLLSLSITCSMSQESAVIVEPKVVSTWWSLARLINPETKEFYKRPSCVDLSLNPVQMAICNTDKSNGFAKIRVAARSSLASIRECARQFRDRRWNCTSYSKRSDTGPIFGAGIQLNDTREAAFIHALMSASIAHEAAEACSKGLLPDCSCAVLTTEELAELKKKIPPSLVVKPTKNDKAHFSWGNCHSNVEYGVRFARVFTASIPRQIPAWDVSRHLMNEHNEKAGEKLVTDNIKVACKCHGLSGSCAAKVCWRTLESFNKMGNYLLSRYKNATQMTYNASQKALARTSQRSVPASARDLIYTERSPSYCDMRPQLGILGTHGRQCQQDGNGPDNCDVMCCDRGYNQQRLTVTSRCKCRFYFCCEVRCQSCNKTISNYFCN